MGDSTNLVWGSPPVVHLGERCPACTQQQFADHPVWLITAAEVDEDFLEIVIDMVWEDDRGNVDWERLWEGTFGTASIEGYKGDDGRCWMLPDQMDDPVFDKIKRGIRKMRKDG
jgi:hypothetical protein